MMFAPAKSPFADLCPVFIACALLSCAAAPDASPPETPTSGGADTPAAGAGAMAAPQVPGAVANCQAWAMLEEGAHRYENNVWGSKKAKGKFQQCLLSRERDGKKEIGWTWNWPGFDPSVFAYPEVVVGWKPWSGGATTDRRLPVKVSDVTTLTLDYEVETEATGSYNLAPEIWLTNAKASQRPNPKSITTEVMFWMDYAAGARPAGSVVDHVELNGVTYELWRQANIGADANGQGWQLLSFKSPERQLKGRIDIAAMLRHLTTAKWVSPSDYVASVEFGNEVMGGTGTTWIKHFDVGFEP